MPRRPTYHKPRQAAAEAVAYERSTQRKADRAFYNGPRWRSLRAAYLAEHPLCEPCDAAGRVVSAAQVHHRKERKDCPALAFEWSNLESVCLPCHNAKRGRQDAEAT